MTDYSGWTICPRCGHALSTGPREGEDRDLLNCRKCGLILYDNPAPTACAIVTRDGLVMLTLRAIEPAAGKWDLPGGYIEVGETPEEALLRELREETGLEVEIRSLFGFFLDTYGDGGTDTLNICFDAEVVGGVERAASDVAEIRWFEPESLPPSDELAFRNTTEALDEYRRRLRG